MVLEPVTVGIILGVANGTVLVVGSCIARGAIDEGSVGLAVVVLFASYNLWPPVVLMGYAAVPNMRVTLPNGLRGGYEVYLAGAAFGWRRVLLAPAHDHRNRVRVRPGMEKGLRLPPSTHSKSGRTARVCAKACSLRQAAITA
jgi:hypothetical protein